MVVSNVDAPFTSKYLLPPAYAQVRQTINTPPGVTTTGQSANQSTVSHLAGSTTDPINRPSHPSTPPQAQDHDTRRFSSSVVSLLWAFDKTYAAALRHHNVLLAAGARDDPDGRAGRAAWTGLFGRNEFDPEAFNCYVHAPARWVCLLVNCHPGSCLDGEWTGRFFHFCSLLLC